MIKNSNNQQYQENNHLSHKTIKHKNDRDMSLEIQFVAWDTDKNLAELNR